MMTDTKCREEKNHLFYRNSNMKIPVAASAEGCYVTDVNGKRYLDGSGGAAVSNCGHSHPAILAAIVKQMERVIDTHNQFFITDSQKELAQHLYELSHGHLARSIFCSSGSEAVEVSIKLARQYHVERGEPKRHHVISRLKSYHGNTLSALSLSDSARGPMFTPYYQALSAIPAFFPYRYQNEDETLEQYSLRCASALETEIIQLGPETVSAFIVETVVGSTLGAVATPQNYLKRIREICNKYGVLLIFDEVMCGAGRTGTFFAYEQELVRPDIITLAKGLSGGHIPLSAICTTAEVHSVIECGSGVLGSNHTYMGHPLACAAGLGVMEILRKTDLLQSVSGKGNYLLACLEERFIEHPHVDYIRGRGLFIALEIVHEKGTKKQFPASLKIAHRIRDTALELGLICWAGQGSAVEGGDFILLAPPFVISQNQMGELIDLLTTAIDQAISNAEIQ